MPVGSQPDLGQKFEECKVACKCDGEECAMADLNQCPVCFPITKWGCSKKACLQKDGSKPVMICVNQQSKPKANAGKESRKPKSGENESDSFESMFEYGSDQSELPEWSDIDDSFEDDENTQLLEGAAPPVNM